jgi:hypothetical protein
MARVGFSAGLAAAILCAASAFAHAQQQQYGQPPSTYVTWGGNTPGQTSIDVTYFVGDASLSTNQANLIRQAAAAWNNTGSFVHLVEATGPGAATTANVVFQIGNTGSTAVVAATTLPTTPGAGLLNGQSWVQINGQVVVTASSLFLPFYWDGNPVIQPPGTINFLTVALQMTGFALGLGPAALGDTNSVMSQTFPLGPGGLTAPTANDVLALDAVYGSPEPATVALFGVGLAALGLGRKFRRV